MNLLGLLCQVMGHRDRRLRKGEVADDAYAIDRAKHVRNGVHTNGIESVWAVLKRGIHGVYHKASPKHLRRYVDEFTFRLNEGNVRRHTFERLNDLIAAAGRRRITYKELIA